MTPKAMSSTARSARIGHALDDPYGTHMIVTMAGMAMAARETSRPPRGENAITNDPR